LKSDVEEYYIVDFEADAGIKGTLKMRKEQFDEADVEFVYQMVCRVVDAWLKRRAFEHSHLELYHTLS